MHDYCSVLAQGQGDTEAERIHILSVPEERGCRGCSQGNERKSEWAVLVMWRNIVYTQSSLDGEVLYRLLPVY